MNLPTNSSITIDGFTINGNAAVIQLWMHVITKSMSAGKVDLITLSDHDGMRSVLVTPSSSVSSFYASADYPEGTVEAIDGSGNNPSLARWVNVNVEPTDHIWSLVEALGISAEIAKLSEE